MKQKKTLIELYNILLLQFSDIDYKFEGICFNIKVLNYKKLINNEEYHILCDHFKTIPRPTYYNWFISLFTKVNKDNWEFYWKPKSYKQRIRFIKKIINQLKE